MVDQGFGDADLLPRSRVGVVAPWLVIATPDNAVIRLDLRVVDRVAVADRVGEDDDDDPRSYLMLVCGEHDVNLYIADGPDAVECLVREAAPLTRDGSFASTSPDSKGCLIVGDDPVLLRDAYIVVRQRAYRLDEVEEYARQGANIPLGDNHLLQAALALFVVQAAEHAANSIFNVDDFWTARSGTGDGPPIVWLHDAGLWDYLAPAAAMTDPVCVSYRYDQRSCGRTRARGGSSLALNVADLDALRAHWGLERFILAGHGWGAALAVLYTLVHPEHVAGRALFGAREVFPEWRDIIRRELQRRLGPDGKARFDSLTSRLDADNTLDDERALLELWLTPEFVDPACARRLFVDDVRLSNVHVSVEDAYRAHVLGSGFLDRLHDDRVPTLVVHGEHDAGPVSLARELTTLLPGADLLVVPRAGFFPWIEAPELVRVGLHELVRRTRSTTR